MDKKWKLIEELKGLKQLGLENSNMLDKDQIQYNISRIQDSTSLHELHYFEEFILFINEVYIKGELEGPSSSTSCFKILKFARYFNLDGFAKKFSLSQMEFENNLTKLIKNINDSDLSLPPNLRVKPAQMAFDYVKDDLNDEIKMLTFTCKFAAIQLATYPFISLLFRDYLSEYGILSTAPTEEGLKELDVMHPSFRVKRIDKKKLSDFSDDFFADISQCEKSGLITLTLELPQERSDYLFS